MTEQRSEDTRVSGWLVEHEDHEHGHRYLHATKYQGKLVGEAGVEDQQRNGTSIRPRARCNRVRLAVPRLLRSRADYGVRTYLNDNESSDREPRS